MLGMANQSDVDAGTVGGLFGATMLVFLFGAAPAAAVIGMPLFFILRGRVRASALLCSLLGAAIGLGPLLVWSVRDFAIGMTSMTLIAGAFGGLTFWWIARRELNQFQG